MDSKNPFSALILANQENSAEDAIKINEMVEDVFHFTINKDAAYYFSKNSSHLVYLEELAESVAPRTMIDGEILEQGLFERILLAEPSTFAVPKNPTSIHPDVVQKEVIPYLFSCEQNLFRYLDSTDEKVLELAKKMQGLIFRNAVTALKQPTLFENQILCDQLFTVLKMAENHSHNFFNGIVNEFMSDDTTPNNFEDLKTVIKPIIKLIHTDVMKSLLISLEMYVFPALNLFASNEYLAEILLEMTVPQEADWGIVYQNSLIGALLSLSVLPKTRSGKYEYFSAPLAKVTSVEEESLWKASEHLISNLHKVFLKLLKTNSKCKHMLLEWIANCLHHNSSRGKIWASQMSREESVPSVSDGFMLNLSLVLLMLCQPFCSTSTNTKWLSIDPTYCAVEDDKRKDNGVHMHEMYKETCVIPPREIYEDVERPSRLIAQKPYNFITECFFLAHKSLDLGYRIIVDNLIKQTQELNQIRQTIASAVNDPNLNDLNTILEDRIKGCLIKLISMRCVLRDPQLIKALSNLHTASCNWLVQLAIHPNPDKTPLDTYAPLKLIELRFPLADDEPDALRCCPEFIVENIVGFLTAARHVRPVLGDENVEFLESALTTVVVFMGSLKKMRNPHLRARLAECLAAMLPHSEDDEVPLNQLHEMIRQKLFREHAYRMQIVPSLLNVFVGIEVTGENVQFEQKFNYRRPMYLIMDYLWEIEEHRDCFKQLSKDAEANMEAVTPPIFLRFINLLINDAVFLLDEALNNMSQIRTMEAINSADLAQRPINEREEHYHNLRYVGMIARFDNILGHHTIGTLEKLTTEIKSVFCHPTMVDRIASMLNYFLLHLVGPNRKNFKVKDKKKYEFDPVSTVLDICKIYVHLGDNEDFCIAVSQDGRSYSPKLFKLAEEVLARIRDGGPLISSMLEVGARVSELAQKQLMDEEALADAPDEFLDPIMSTVMMDPVILPSSKINIDRTTIARHLLSDQSDPFNRSPLSMDQVIPNDELKEKIQQWIEQKRKAHKSSA